MLSETRYLGEFEEFWKKTGTQPLVIFSKTVHISDETGKFALIEDDGTNVLTRYQHTNHLGSSNLETDSAGMVISYEEYHPFGTTAYRATLNSLGSSAKRYRFCGKEKDEESGLYYYGARYYASWLGRFMSVDPKESKYFFQSSYAYAENSPVTKMDWNGEGTDLKVRDENETLHESSSNETTTTSAPQIDDKKSFAKGIEGYRISVDKKTGNSTISKTEIISMEDSGTGFTPTTNIRFSTTTFKINSTGAITNVIISNTEGSLSPWRGQVWDGKPETTILENTSLGPGEISAASFDSVVEGWQSLVLNKPNRIKSETDLYEFLSVDNKVLSTLKDLLPEIVNVIVSIEFGSKAGEGIGLLTEALINLSENHKTFIFLDKIPLSEGERIGERFKRIAEAK